MRGRVKRYLAGFLAAVTVLTSSNLGYALEVQAAGSVNGNEWSASAAEIVAEEYYNGSVKGEIITSGLVDAGETFTAKVPSKVLGEAEMKDYVSVESISGGGIVYVKEYTDSYGNVWTPVKANVVSGTETKDTIDAFAPTTKAGFYGEANYAFVGPCSVQVEYQLEVTIEEGEQKRILSIPVYLAEGIDNLETLLASDSDFVALNSNMSVIKSLVENLYEEDDKDDILIKLETLATNLEALLKQNDDYAEDKENAVAYVMAKGNDVKAVVADAYSIIKKFYENPAFMDLIVMYDDEMNSDVEGIFHTLVGEGGVLVDLKDRSWHLAAEAAQADVFGKTDAGEIAYNSGIEAYKESLLELAGDLSVPDAATVNFVVAADRLSCNVAAAEVKVEVKVETADSYDNDAYYAEASNKNTLIFGLDVVLTAEEKEVIADEIDKTIADAVTKWKERYAKEYGVELSDEVIAAEYPSNKDEILKKLDELVSLTEDGCTFTIVFNPNLYEMTIVDAVTNEVVLKESYPYGQDIKLGREDAEEQYDYYVMGESGAQHYYDQGAVITVTENLMVARAEAAEKVSYSIFELLSKDTQYGLTEGESAILDNDAYKCGEVKIRYPEAVTVTVDGETTTIHPAGEVVYNVDDNYYELVVTEYASGVADMVWKPATVVLMNGETNLGEVTEYTPQTFSFNPEGIIEGITDETHTYVWDGDVEFTHAVITYKLAVTSVSVGKGYEPLDNADVQEGLDIPATLSKLAKEQKALLSEDTFSIKAVYESLKSNGKDECALTQKMMSMLATVLTSSEKKEAAGEIVDNCFKGDELAIFYYMRNCVGTPENPWPLSAFWKNDNYANIKKQAAFLAERLPIIVGEEGDKEFKDALENAVALGLVSQAQIDEYVDVIDELVEKLDKFNAIEGPNALLDVNAPGFNKLVDEILPVANVSGNTYSANGLYAYASYNVYAPKFVTAVVDVKLDGKTIGTAEHVLYVLEDNETSYEFAAADADKINASIAEIAAANGITKELLEKVYYGEVITGIPTTGTPVSGKIQVTAKYTTEPYTVNLKDEKGNVAEFKTLYYGKDMKIDLPAHSEDETDVIYYVYTIENNDVKVVSPYAGEYTFKDFDSFENQNLTISRVTVDSRTEKMLAFVADLNKELGKTVKMKFVPEVVYDNGHSNGRVASIEMLMTVTKDLDMAAVMEALGNTFASLKYNYVGFGDVVDGQSVDGFVYLENGEIRLNPQAFLNMFLNADITSDSLIDAIDNNESILNTTIHLGNNNTDFENVPFSVKLAEDETGYLSEVSSLLATLKQNGFVIDISNGKVLVSGAVNEKLFNAYLSLMLLLDSELSIEDFDPSLENQLESMISIIRPVLEDENFNWTTVKNTLKQLGFTGNLDKGAAAFEKLIDVTKKLYNKNENRPADAPMFENSGNNWFEFNVSYDTAAVLGKVGIPDALADMIAETKLSVPFKFELVNIKDSYEALVIDMGKSVSGMINYTDDLAAALENAEGTTFVVLLGNVARAADGQPEKVLNLKHPTIINLNGKQILCDIDANNATLKVVNSAMDVTDDGYAGVFGDVTGSNVTLTAGAYLARGLENIDKMISGAYKYTEEDGYVFVENKYYTLTETEDTMTVELTSDFAAMLEEDVKDLVIDMAADILFRSYTSACLTMDGHDIYSFDVDSLVDFITNTGEAVGDLVECFDEEGITWILNELLDQFTDYEKLSKVLVSEDLTVASYEVTTAPWAVVARINDANVIEVGVEPGRAVTKTFTLKFKEANAALSNTFAELDNIVTVGSDIILEKVAYNNGFEIQGTAGLDIVVNMLGKDGAASDYVTTMAVLLAYNMEDGAEKEEFLKAIEYYDGNVYGGYLKDAINAVTLGDLKDALDKAKTVDSFEVILGELGLIGTEVGNHSAELEECYAPLLDAFKEVEKEVDAVAGNRIDHYFAGFGQRTLGSIKGGENGHYGFSVSYPTDNVWISLTLKLFASDADEETYTDDAQAFLDKVAEIPTPVQGSEESLKEQAQNSSDKISEALDAYEKLTDEQKKIVKDAYEKLKEIVDFYEEKLGAWAADIEDLDYSASKKKPEPEVYHGAVRLVKNTDYTLSWKNNTSAAKATDKKAPTVVIKFKKNYSGTIYQYFTINQINLSGDAEYFERVGLTISDVSQSKRSKKGYTAPTIKLQGKKVDSSKFKFTYPTGKEYKNYGSYAVVITSKSKNFTGSYTAKLEVLTTLLKNVKVTKSIGSQNYNAEGVTLNASDFTLKYNKNTLILGEDFEILSYTNNDKIGKATVTLRGLGYNPEADTNGMYFGGTRKLEFSIKAVGTLKSIKLFDSSKVYTGNAIELVSTGDARDFDVLATVNGAIVTLTEGTDYDITYKKNTKVGTATMTVKGKGGYKGTLTKQFKITKEQLDSTMMIEGKDLVVRYTKGGTKPTAQIKLIFGDKVLKYGTDYTIKWGNNTKAREATDSKAPYFTISGKGNFKGSFTEKFTIVGGTLTSEKITVKDKLYKNDKYNYKTTVTVKDTNNKTLKSGTDYKVTYEIKNADGQWVAVSQSDLYTKSRIKLSSQNPEAELRVVISGLGNYKESVIYKEFRMYYKNIAKSKIEVPNYRYSKYTTELRKKIENEMKVYYAGNLLTEGVDYDYEIVSIKNYQNAGSATVKITGLNAYGGTLSKKFTIFAFKQDKVKLTKDMVAESTANLVVKYVKGGSAKPAAADIKLSYVDASGNVINLVYGRDFTVKYYNTKSVRKATAKSAPRMEITGKDNYKGTIKVTYTISK